MSEEEKIFELEIPAEPQSTVGIVPRADAPTKPGIRKLAIHHEQIINWYLLNPHRADRDCAAYFGVTQSWISTIKQSDAFKARVQQKLALMDESVRDAFLANTQSGILERLNTAVDVALTKLTSKIEETEDPEFLLDATDKLCHRLGFAPKATPIIAGPHSVTNNTLNVTIDAQDLASAREMLKLQGTRSVEGEIKELEEIKNYDD